MSKIWLDGIEYNLVPGTYQPSKARGMTTRLAVTGAVDRTESGIYVKRYAFTISCTYEQLAQIEGTYQKTTPPNNLLDFVDLRGFSWLVAAGANDALHAYGTGVYIEGAYDPKRETDAAGWDDTNMFQVPCSLIVNSKGFKS